MLKRILTGLISLLLIPTLLWLSSASNSISAVADGDRAIYTDSLATNWENWSWNSEVSFNQSISFRPNGYGGLYLHSKENVDVTKFSHVKFNVKAANNAARFQLVPYDHNYQTKPTINLSNFGGDPKAGEWVTYQVPVSQLQTTSLNGLAIQDSTGQTLGETLVDDFYFVSNSGPVAPTATPTIQPTATVPAQPTPTLVAPGSSVAIYTDNLSNAWENWSWNLNIDFNHNDGAVTRSKSIRTVAHSPWSGLYLHAKETISTERFQALALSLKQNGMQPKVALYNANNRALRDFVSLEKYQTGNVNGFTTYVIPLSDLNARNTTVAGVVIHDESGNGWGNMTVDDISLVTSGTVAQPTPAPTNAVVPSPQPTVAAPQVNNGSGFTVSGNRIYRNGQEIILRGVNWFGAETGTYAPHGLWVRNYKEMITQMKGVGFNAVRLPFCPTTLRGVNVTGVDYDKNPDMRGLNSLDVYDKIVNELNNQQMYVLLDHHRPDCEAISELWYTGSYSESQWIQDLVTIAGRYKNLPFVMGVDLKNEPHGQATWGTGNQGTDWNTAAERAGTAVLQANPNILVFVEGIGWSNTCSSQIAPFWGENFEPYKCAQIKNIPANKLVLSPHVYGPDVNNQSYFNEGNFPQNMNAIWDSHFGFLTQSNTVVIGEWGGKFGASGGQQKDIQLQTQLMDYMKSKRMCSSFYWSWNPNSGDTGGILQDDWTNVWQQKTQALQNFFATCQ